MKKKEIHITASARYFVKSDDAVTNFTWLCLHGYGQLAEYFIRHFSILGHDHKVIAPEGLHRFYLSNNSGRVGASWMTKLEREKDIETYCNYLNQVLDKESEPTDPIIAFGFSQGTATIGRWICQAKRPIQALVLWAGAWPHDMNIDHSKALLDAIPIYIIVGDQDQYLGNEGISKYLQAFDDSGIKYTLLRFSGDHRLDKTMLLEVSQRITGKKNPQTPQG